MASNHSSFHLVIGGVGGKGVLLAGRLLAEAALQEFPHVLWFPNYAASMRGGDCECTVVLSQHRIASPISLEPSAAIIMDPAARKKFEGRVRPDGLLMLDSSVMPEETRRKDVRARYVPATEIATELGAALVVNLVLLGAFLEVTRLVPAEAIKSELEKRFLGSRREALLATNIEALRRGAEYLAQKDSSSGLSIISSDANPRDDA
jgi:2-oxoglutarate ferredoxin oxidoreductase subunit gamma